MFDIYNIKSYKLDDLPIEYRLAVAHYFNMWKIIVYYGKDKDIKNSIIYEVSRAIENKNKQDIVVE